MEFAALTSSSTLWHLTTATLIGGTLGLNRQLHRKPAGLRTQAMVALGAALAGAIGGGDASRVIPGVLTGIGFLGAGVIIHHDADHRVEGLTTAASIWVAGILGLSCGTGHSLEATETLVLALLVLIVGGVLERAFCRLMGGPANPAVEPECKSE